MFIFRTCLPLDFSTKAERQGVVTSLKLQQTLLYCDLGLAVALHPSCSAQMLKAEINSSSSCLFSEEDTIGNTKLQVPNTEVIH